MALRDIANLLNKYFNNSENILKQFPQAFSLLYIIFLFFYVVNSEKLHSIWLLKFNN